MGEFRALPAEGFVKEHVQRRTGQPFLTSDHVRDPHQMVVDDVGEVVGGHAVALEQHLVVDVGAVHVHPAADPVLEAHFVLAGHLQSHHMRLSIGQPRLHLIRAQGERIPHVLARHGVVGGRRYPGRLQALPHGFQLVRRVERMVGLVLGDEFIGVALVHGLALALPVGPVGAAHPGALIGGKAAPVQ